jgi:hypothetical protein
VSSQRRRILPALTARAPIRRSARCVLKLCGGACRRAQLKHTRPRRCRRRMQKHGPVTHTPRRGAHDAPRRAHAPSASGTGARRTSPTLSALGQGLACGSVGAWGRLTVPDPRVAWAAAGLARAAAAVVAVCTAASGGWWHRDREWQNERRKGPSLECAWICSARMPASWQLHVRSGGAIKLGTFGLCTRHSD